MSKLPRSFVRGLPAIGWRDEKLEEQRTQLNEVRAQLRDLDQQRRQLRADVVRLEQANEKIRQQHEQRGTALAEESAKLVKTRARLAEAREKRTENAARRKEAVARAKAETEKSTLKAIQKAPSFHRSLRRWRRFVLPWAQMDPEHLMPYNQIEYKLHNYRFGQSHGVSVPRVLEVWPTPSAIDLAEMPDLFVLKSDQGSSGRGVLPLRRIGFDSYELVDGQGSFTMASVVEHFEAREGTGKIAGPYFAEEFLDQAHSGPLPDDVKIYVCHGEVMMTLLRHVDTHGLQGEHRRRYVSAEGTDLGAVMLAMDVDDTIEMPVDYAEMVQIASHLSRALGVPFARVDLYQTTVGPVLGEITRAPGDPQTYRPEHDEYMGRVWDEATARLELDVLRGRPAGRSYGDHPAENLYPADHWSHSLMPLEEGRTRKCDVWCGSASDAATNA